MTSEPVEFRAWNADGEVFAVFQASDSQGRSRRCYQSGIGFGAVAWPAGQYMSREADPAEYADLLSELRDRVGVRIYVERTG